MSKPTVSTKTIASIERLNNSTVGNPRFRITFTDGSIHNTFPNSSCNYEIGNPGYRSGDVVVVHVEGKLERIGRIYGLGRDYETDRMLYQWTAAQIDPDTTSDDLQGPGRYDGCSDRVFAWALETLYGVGACDEEGGSVEDGCHMARFGRYVLTTDDCGFVNVVPFESEQEAVERMSAVEAAQLA